MRRLPPDRRVFFEAIEATLFPSGLSTERREGLNAILDGWQDRFPKGDLRWLAYILATAYHETAFTMQPVRETLASSDEEAVARLDRAFANGKLSWVKTVYWSPDEDGKTWLGRGLVQLTHKRNYEEMSRLTGIDLTGDPSRAMEMPVAVSILIDGMIAGSFTKHRLCDHFNDQTEDWVNARRIVNGTDRAEKIAGYAKVFLSALEARPAAGGRLKRFFRRAIAPFIDKKQR
ncbi:hypothetical protein [Oryzifoliimicrobium ureilyticus]|uniref:hypothetical protein n=1 Tax=Oryzifoliimicrobium ureilyticus TaxID=3113724 RepID=UPI0030762B3E